MIGPGRSFRFVAGAVLTSGILVIASGTGLAQTPSPDPRCMDQIEPGPTPLDCPDLTFVSTPSVAVADDATSLVVMVPVQNVGTLASEATTLLVAVEGWPSASSDLPGLESGAQQPVEVELEIPAGSEGLGITLDVFIDPDNVVGELDENDNFTSTIVTLPSPTPTTTTSPPTTTEPPTASPQPSEVTTSGAGTSSDDSPPWWWIAPAIAAVAALILASWFARHARRRALPRYEPAEAPRTPPSRPARVVSTGFSSAADPGTPLDPDRTLVVSSEVCFWLEVGEPVPGSIEAVPTGIPPRLVPPSGVDVDVTLMPLGRQAGFEVVGDVGSIALLGSGDTFVRDQPRQARKLGLPAGLLDRRLFFELRAPSTPGIYRMRCGLYRNQTLIQSRVITAEVTASSVHRVGALRAETDYTLSGRLDPSNLTVLPAHTLSVMLNRSDDDTHDLVLVGRDYRIHVALDALVLQHLVRVARGGLRYAAWGDDEEWSVGKRYLYAAPSFDRLRDDLVRMAQRGMALYTAVVQGLDGGRAGLEQLERDLASPGALQIALGRTARRILPASLVYDYRGLETQASVGAYSLCGSFLDALVRGVELGETVCFRDVCPARGRELVVCPSGFWGFRHEIGFPVSEDGRETVPSIAFREAPAITIGVSTDANLVERPEHERVMHELWGRGAWGYADSRTRTLEALRDSSAQIVYLYCHGGITDIGEPYVQVGPLTEPGITATVLLNEDVFWEQTRPLVFINGCHTTAVEPEKAFEMVSPLVALSGAAGVIGTEITVFEPIARSFAESFFPRFLAGESLGAAVRGARLDLLGRSNPLGLAYIPFALPGLRLQPQGAA